MTEIKSSPALPSIALIEKRDPVTGRYIEGTCGGRGRIQKGRINFCKLVQEKAKEKDHDVEEAIWELYESLLLEARLGNVVAAKILIDNLCTTEDMEQEGHQLTDAERDARILSIIARSRMSRGITVEPATAEDELLS